MLLFEFAHNLGISVEDAILAKLARNELRYPVDKAHGSNAKYTEL
jgi:dCTP diphosphatase